MLKGRWPFLRSIRIQLTEDKRSLTRVIKYVTVCVVLHNLLIGFGDEPIDLFEEDVSDVDADNELNQPLDPLAHSAARREQLLNFMLERFY